MVQGRRVQVLAVVGQRPCRGRGQPGRRSISSCGIPGKQVPCRETLGCLDSRGETTLLVSEQEGEIHSDMIDFNFEL